MTSVKRVYQIRVLLVTIGLIYTTFVVSTGVHAGPDPARALHATAATTTQTFITDADAGVQQSNPSTNYGTTTTLRVDGASDPGIASYLHFTLTGVSGTIQSALLRVFDTSDGSSNGPAIYATSNNWTETGI